MRLGRFVWLASRSVLAVLLGMATLVVLSGLVQDTLLGGVHFYRSSLTTLATAAVLTPLAAAVAGAVTAAIAGREPVWHIVPMCTWTVFETAFLARMHPNDSPLWWKAAAGLGLIVGATAGAWAWKRLVTARGAAPAPAPA